VDKEIEVGMVRKYYQVYNKKNGRWVKIDRYTGLIVAVKKTPGPYKNIHKGYLPPPRRKQKGFFKRFFG